MTIEPIKMKNMDYKEEYKRALNTAKMWYRNTAMPDNVKEILSRIFPELKESEDERIRTWLEEHIEAMPDNSVEFKDVKRIDVLHWLEEQKTSYTKKDVDDAYLKGISDTKNEIKRQYEANYQIRKDIATFIFNYRGDIKDRAKWMNYLGIKVSFTEEKQGGMSNKNDERLRKTTISFLEDFAKQGYENAVECIDWLEKIGEHLKFCKTIQIGDRVTRNEGGVLVNMSQFDRIAKPRKIASPIKWYDVSLIPQEQQELLVEWDSEDVTWHDVAFYHADTKTFWNCEKQIKGVTRWCYIKDLLGKQDKKEPVNEAKDYNGIDPHFEL